jgi:hypothetical protein
MISDYEDLLEIVRIKLELIGFSLREDTDFVAYFSGDSDWEISFEGDKYVRPSFNLSVENRDSEFSIRILMKLFKNHKKPSLDEQLNFLIDNHRKIFVFPPPYADEYEILNTSGT